MEERKCIDCIRYKEDPSSFPCILCAELKEKPYFVSMFEEEPEIIDYE
jgi:hypothetical protein